MVYVFLHFIANEVRVHMYWYNTVHIHVMFVCKYSTDSTIFVLYFVYCTVFVQYCTYVHTLYKQIRTTRDSKFSFGNQFFIFISNLNIKFKVLHEFPYIIYISALFCTFVNFCSFQYRV